MMMIIMMMIPMMIMMTKAYDYADDTNVADDHKNDRYAAVGAGHLFINN